ncbi:outer membrane protein B [Chlamydia ibidis 10-1398/6]|uniref:Outer membrane protein B n=1 Tax=Chlamydia ibidis 10-1398/6 TaxID=1046581 RepID=A0ABN0MYB5_9CHLA|nr:outer membrane protein B [Chlamydia ibidis 10-1398/6]
MKRLRLATLSFLALSGAFSSSLYATPAGNPATPVLPGINPEQQGWGALELCRSYDLFAALAGSLKVGFCGDYIFSESSRVSDVPVITSVTTLSGSGPATQVISTEKTMDFDLTNSRTNVSCVFASISLQDISSVFIPLLDVSFEVKIGGLKDYCRLPVNAYRDFTSSPLATESQATNGLIEMQTNYGFVWDLCLRKILWKDGVSFIGASASYRHAACPIDYVVIHNQANPEVFFADSNGKMSHKEWGAHLGMTTYVNDYILPYIGVGVGNTTRMAPADCFNRLESEFTNLKFKVRKINSYRRVMFCCGATSCPSNNFFYTVEGRWGCQRAVHVAGGFHF